METANINYTRGIYNLSKMLENEDRYYTLENKDLLNSECLNTEFLKVERRNHFNSDTLEFYYFLRFRTCTNWQRCKKTGLAVTGINNVFHGNISTVIELQQQKENGKLFENPKDFVIAQFIKDNKILIIDIFENFYPVNYDARICFVNEHKLYQ